jgi:hypothetical protein
MNANPVEPLSVKAEAGVSIVDLDKLAESIWRDLHGQVDQSEIRQVLVDLKPKYQEARILTFIPVLMRRNAIEILRHRSK